MTAMNYESNQWRRDAVDEAVLDAGAAEKRRKRRLILGAAAALILIVAAVFLFAGPGENAAAPAGAKAEQSLPAVTVVVPGRQDIPAIVTATGSLAARRDLPVGVPGEGGQVERVLVEPGQWVRAGQTLAVINRSVQSQEAAQLAAQVEVARADLRLAQNELDRAEALVDRGFISQADLDRKRATRDAAAARVRVAEAQLAATRARIGRLDVRAPASGLVLDRSVEAGQVVGPGSGALFRIAQGGEMELLAQLPQNDLERISVGVPASVTPVGSQQSYQGQVWQISPIIDPQTRQGQARIAVPYHEDLRPGGFASAAIRAGSRTAPLLPESAVLNDDAGSYVYAVGGDNRVVRRAVTVGEVTSGGVTILDGLSGNEAVVVSAGAFLNPGDEVIPRRRARG